MERMINSRVIYGLIYSLLIAFGQVILFIVLHDSSINWGIAMGQPSHVRGGVNWGVKVYYSVYIFTAICLLCNVVSFLFFEKQRAYVPLIGFAVFLFPFIGDLFHLRSWTYPKRALLLVSCALIALVFPYLIFQAVSKFKYLRKIFQN